MPTSVLAANAAGGESALPFNDVKEGSWYYQGVDYVYNHGLMVGTSTSFFSPNLTTTRGMIVTILHSLEGYPAADGKQFNDVKEGKYYSNAVAWASAESIVAGYTNGSFRPNDHITRQQLVAILYKYAVTKEYIKEDNSLSKITKYSDYNSISDYAKPALEWAVNNGLISGIGNNLIDPKGKATRAQVAVILMQFCKKYASIDNKENKDDQDSVDNNSDSKGNNNTKQTDIPDESKEDTYTVKFDLNYGDSDLYRSIKVVAGTAISNRPIDPIRDGYEFIGWSIKSVGRTLYDFEKPVNKDITLYAVWEKADDNQPTQKDETYIDLDDYDIDFSKSTYTRGEWIAILAYLLEMDLNVDTENVDFYFADTEENENGIAIETCNAFGILPEPELEDLEQDVPMFYPDEIATREFVAYTVVKAMGFDGSHDDVEQWDDYNATKYQDEVAISILFDFLKLQGNRFLPGDPIDGSDIKQVVKGIDKLEKTTEVKETYNNNIYSEDVVEEELRNVTDYTVQENDEQIIITIPKGKAPAELNSGTVIVLPATESMPGGVAAKIVSKNNAGNSVQYVCQKPELSEVYDSIDMAGATSSIDLSKGEPEEGVTCEYIPNGSIDDDDSEIYPIKKDIDLDNSISPPGTIKLKIGDDGKIFKISDKASVKGTIEFEIPKVTYKFKGQVGAFGDSTTFEEALFKAELKIKNTLEVEYKAVDYGFDEIFANKAIRKKLYNQPIAPIAPGVTLNITIYFEINAKGSVGIVYTMQPTLGYQYINKSSRFPCSYADSLEVLQLKGTFEAGPVLGLNIDLAGFVPIIGLEGFGGLSVEGSLKPHVLATQTLFCADVTVFPFLTLRLSETSAVGLFLKGLHLEWEHEVFKNDRNNPYKLKLHIENGRRVKECTFGTGTLKGTVKAKTSKNPVKNARICVYDTVASKKNPVRTVYTDSNGNYTINNLTSATYKIVVSATKYQTYTNKDITVSSGQTTYNNVLLMVERNTNEGTATGQIKNAVTGEGIKDCKYKVRKDWSNRSGDIVQEGVFDDSEYTLTLPSGNYTLIVEKSGFSTNSINIAITENNNEEQNIILSPISSGTGTNGVFRVVLTWGEQPYDLDSHLFGPTDDSGADLFHTFYSAKTATAGDIKLADLDIDDVTSYGPETTTVYKIEKGSKYSFYVHDYTNRDNPDSGALADSEAKVELYINNDYYVFYVPTNEIGTVWHVFDYDPNTGLIMAANDFSTTMNTYSM